MMRPSVPFVGPWWVSLALVLLASSFTSCASPAGNARLARQAAMGMTIEHQVLRFADQLLYDALDCAGTPEANAAAIASAATTRLGTCAEVMQVGPELDVMTGASCAFGERVYASLASHVTVAREGSDLVVAMDLESARINGLVTDGTVTLRSADCRTFRASLDLASTEYALVVPASAPLVVESAPARTTVTGALEVTALDAPAAERDLVVDHDAMIFGTGQCWPEGGAIVGARAADAITIAFDPATTTMGDARVTPAVDGTSAYLLPHYGPCPDTDSRP
jgi:hypothetical protein